MRRVRGTVVLLAALALLAAACGGSDGSGAADDSTAVLASAADRLDAEQRYRYEMFLTMRMGGGGELLEVDPDEPMARGARDGGRYHATFDFGPTFRSMSGAVPAGEAPELEQLLGGDTTLEVVGDEEVAYLRAPFFAALAALDPAAAGGLGELGALRDRWGRIDLATLAVDRPGEVAEALGAQLDPTELVDLLRSAGDVRELGDDTVRGVAVDGLAGEVPLDDLPGAGMFGSPPGASVEGLTTTLEAWVDAEGRVRRIEMRITTEEFLAALGEAPDGAPPDMVFEMASTLDVFDYSAEVQVELPSDEDAVDVTQAFSALLGPSR